MSGSSGMTYRRLGGTDTMVSPICLGMWKIGKYDDAAACKILSKAYGMGINFFDTSDNYGTEHIIGKAVKEGYLPKEKIVVATKTGLPTTKEEQKRFHTDLSPKRIKEQLEKSRKLLGLDTVHLYQAHAPDGNTSTPNLVHTMNMLIEEGKILHYGVSNFYESDLAEVIGYCESGSLKTPVSLQNLYNVNAISPVLSSAVDYSKSLGMTFMAHSPLGRGSLVEKNIYEVCKVASSRPEVPELGIFDSLLKLDNLAKGNGMTIEQLSLAWLMNDVGSIPVLGSYDESHLKAAVEAASLDMSGLSKDVKRFRKELLKDSKKVAEKSLRRVQERILGPLYNLDVIGSIAGG